MELGIELKMRLKAGPLLGRAPGPPHEPVDIGPDHGGRVIEGKQRVMAPSFKLPLPDYAPPSSRGRLGLDLRELSFDPGGVHGILVTQALSPGIHSSPELPPHSPDCKGSLVFPRS